MWNWSVTSTAVVFKETVGPLRHIVLIFLLLSPSLWVLSMEQAQCKLHTSPIYNPLHLSLLYIMCCKCAWIHSLSMCLAYHFALVVVVIRSSLCLPLFYFSSNVPPTYSIISFPSLPSISKTPSTKTTFGHLSLCPTFPFQNCIKKHHRSPTRGGILSPQTSHNQPKAPWITNDTENQSSWAAL